MILVPKKRIPSESIVDVRVVRGGGWYMSHRCWASYRNSDYERLKEHSLGFRLVLRKASR